MKRVYSLLPRNVAEKVRGLALSARRNGRRLCPLASSTAAHRLSRPALAHACHPQVRNFLEFDGGITDTHVLRASEGAHPRYGPVYRPAPG